MAQLQDYDLDARENSRLKGAELAGRELDRIRDSITEARKVRPTLTGGLLQSLGMGISRHQGGRAVPITKPEPEKPPEPAVREKRPRGRPRKDRVGPKRGRRR